MNLNLFEINHDHFLSMSSPNFWQSGRLGYWTACNNFVLLILCFCTLLYCGAETYWFLVMSKWLPGSHIGFFRFWTMNLVWFWISSPKLSGTSLVCTGRSLLIFSNVTFKILPGGHIGFFSFQTLTSVCLCISSPNFSSTSPVYMKKA